MNIDSYFYIGHSHDICEDYAMSNIFSDVAVAIVSDGCSASTDVDIGCRILSKVANNIINETLDVHDFIFRVDRIKEKIIYSADYAIKELGINQHSLDATLLFAISDGKRLKIRMYGDGFLIFQKANNDIEFYKIAYASNAPYYLTYLLDDCARKSFNDNIGTNSKIISRYVNGKLESMTNADPTTEFEMDIDLTAYKIKTCSICSDGLDSFTRDDMSNVDCAEVVKNFVGFKNMTGDFVKRRIMAYRRDCDKNDINHYDDISMATISFL